MRRRDALQRQLLARTRRGIVFAGHGVTEHKRSEYVEHLHMPLPRFQAIVDALGELDFDFLSMAQVIALSRSGVPHHKHWVHLSFDDGYQNNHDVLLPFLASRGVPFSVVVSTHHIESAARFPTFWLRYAAHLRKNLDGNAQAFFEKHLRFASWDEHERVMERVMALFTDAERKAAEGFANDAPLDLASLQALGRHPLVHVGSHAHHHIVLHASQPEDVVRAELETSRALLRDTWRVSADPIFCYPNGDWAPRWATLCESLGFPLSLLSSSGFVDAGTHPQLVPRFWLNRASRARLLAWLAVVGDRALPLFGRAPPPRSLVS